MLNRVAAAVRLSASLGAEIRGLSFADAGPSEAAELLSLPPEYRVLSFPDEQNTGCSLFQMSRTPGALFSRSAEHRVLSFPDEQNTGCSLFQMS
ncbi:MAG: hypothetical protein QF391_12540, partial [Myxococcota bacterium]|nr:hypothetical protein [Myxococcota bacterium]